MKLVCCITAHNEDWVIGLTARAARLWADEVIVLNHASTDNTQQVLEDAKTDVGDILILNNPNPTFTPLEFYRQLVNQAWLRGATHVAILDADEILSASLLPSLREEVGALSVNSAFEVPWVPIGGTLGSLIQHDRALRTGFVFSVCGPLPYPELHEETYNLHYSRLPVTVTRFRPSSVPGALLHLFYLDERRLQAKELRWKMMEMLRWPGRRSAAWLNDYYDHAVYTKAAAVPLPDDWWTYQHLEKYMRIGGESAIEKEVKKLWTEHSGQFTGLNTFGIV